MRKDIDLDSVFEKAKDDFYAAWTKLSRENNDSDSRAAKYAIDFSIRLMREYHRQSLEEPRE